MHVNYILEHGRASTLVRIAGDPVACVHMRGTVGGAKTLCVNFLCVCFFLAPTIALLRRPMHVLKHLEDFGKKPRSVGPVRFIPLQMSRRAGCFRSPMNSCPGGRWVRAEVYGGFQKPDRVPKTSDACMSQMSRRGFSRIHHRNCLRIIG
eukprot:1138604-Pyramimonas_sp.AAC.2